MQTTVTTERGVPLRKKLENLDFAVDSVLTDVRSCGILVNDLSQTNYFKFAHKTFFEFLVSQYFLHVLLKRKDKYDIMVRGIEKALKARFTAAHWTGEVTKFISELLSLEVSDLPGTRYPAAAPFGSSPIQAQSALAIDCRTLFKQLYPSRVFRHFPPKIVTYFRATSLSYALPSLLFLLVVGWICGVFVHVWTFPLPTTYSKIKIASIKLPEQVSIDQVSSFYRDPISILEDRILNGIFMVGSRSLNWIFRDVKGNHSIEMRKWTETTHAELDAWLEDGKGYVKFRINTKKKEKKFVVLIPLTELELEEMKFREEVIVRRGEFLETNFILQSPTQGTGYAFWPPTVVRQFGIKNVAKRVVVARVSDAFSYWQGLKVGRAGGSDDMIDDVNSLAFSTFALGGAFPRSFLHTFLFPGGLRLFTLDSDVFYHKIHVLMVFLGALLLCCVVLWHDLAVVKTQRLLLFLWFTASQQVFGQEVITKLSSKRYQRYVREYPQKFDFPD